MIAEAVIRVLCWACSALGDPGGCALLNGRLYIGWDEEKDDCRWVIPIPTGRLFSWAIWNRIDR